VAIFFVWIIVIAVFVVRAAASQRTESQVVRPV
jgi:hypothetical protein